MKLYNYLEGLAQANNLTLDRVLITIFDNNAIEEKAILYKGVAEWCWVSDGRVSYAKRQPNYGTLPEWHIWLDC